MNREQLDEIRARAEKATPGPWLREWAFSTHFVVPLKAHDVAAGNVSRLKPHQRADAEFIAAARTDVPALLDEIDRLTQKIKSFEEFGSAEALRAGAGRVGQLDLGPVKPGLLAVTEEAK